jgi:hypothetical protein
MRVLAEFDAGSAFPPSGISRRAAERRPAAARATAREFKGATVAIELTDISTHGCGFESRWPFSLGARLWLALPGLEPWAATVAWHRDGRGGLEFARALHPCVVERYVR